MDGLDKIYGEGFFRRRHKLSWRAETVCRPIITLFNPKSVIDVGCGIGEFVSYFNDNGIRSLGLESTENALKQSVTDKIEVLDVSNDVSDRIFGRIYDLCMCLEVAEHIPSEYAEVFVRNLNYMSKMILFSAAPLGQGGHYHVNCQPIEYWDDLFEKFGYKRFDPIANALKLIWRNYRNKDGIKAYCMNLHFYMNNEN